VNEFGYNLQQAKFVPVDSGKTLKTGAANGISKAFASARTDPSVVGAIRSHHTVLSGVCHFLRGDVARGGWYALPAVPRPQGEDHRNALKSPGVAFGVAPGGPPPKS
jgi:hypothetical protein